MVDVILRVLPLTCIVVARLCAFIAALMPVSRSKGQTRLAVSLLVGAGFVLGALSQMAKEGHLWPGILGFAAGAFLSWIGLRKYRRDPEGITPAAKML